MENNQYLSNFSDDDVVEFEENNIRKLGNIKLLLKHFFEKKEWAEQRLREHLERNSINIKEKFTIQNSNAQEIECYNYWFAQGVECSILQLGSQKWVKGKIKIKITVDFYPDETIKNSSLESPSILDDLRQTIN
ncbi:hypothetical protein C7H19_19630 [Aphanothece hegewaldii CCALA 016]|uniref:KGK family protein n=1 Tax=Aphanothece hegewaldii CCALA 016 TaxID=2107694 RepID=A0A2T1LT35_9CHRO|nr:KGK domain-containing protein [Aphanothece hegewaldii]PSF33603.1 hypothetical protein C7H19_19630 [Aphanothece hegewaldii CCALA 016]